MISFNDYKLNKIKSSKKRGRLNENLDLDAAARGWMKELSGSSILGGVDYTLTDDYDSQEWSKQKENIFKLQEIKMKNPKLTKELTDLLKS